MVGAAQNVLDAEQEVSSHHFKAARLARNREERIAWSQAVGFANAVGEVEPDQHVRRCPVEIADGVGEARRLTPGNTSFTVPTQPSRLEVVRTYLLLGIEHILSGIDHLVFVLALLLLVKGARRLIFTVTAFTLAHSLTLAGATLGYVRMPGPPIEATIALSIMFVASEIMHSRRGNPGLTERYPWVVAFTFGLLHGFGFAGALAQIGLPQTSIPIALLFFNVGVEVGQLLFIASVFAAIALARQITRRIDLPRPAWAWAVPPYAIGGIAAYWVIQRIAAFV